MAGGTSEGGQRAWLTASAARLFVQQTMGGLIDNAQVRLIQWAGDEIVETRCLRLVFKPEARDKLIYDDCAVPSTFWDDMQKTGGFSDWPNGTFEVRGYAPALGGITETRIHGTEFCRDDLRAHLATLGWIRAAPPPPPQPMPATQEVLTAIAKVMGQPPPTPAAERKAKPVRTNRNAPVTDDEIQIWYRALPTEDQARGLRWLHSKAKTDHPRRPVVRKLIEPFVAGRKTGRPTKH